MLEKLKAEIERLQKKNEVNDDKEYAQYELDVACGYDMALDDILSFIDEHKDEVELVLPSEERFVSRIKTLSESEVVCTSCNKIVKTTFYPYGYDPKENEMWYIGICPTCGEVMYTRD